MLDLDSSHRSTSAPGCSSRRAVGHTARDDQPPCAGCDPPRQSAPVGDGVSFSFGDISLGPSQNGAGQGLRVLFRTFTHSRLEVFLAGSC